MKFKNDIATMNAVIDGLGALVFAVVHEFPPEQRRGFAATLARMAQAAERETATTTATLLLELHRAAVAAS